MHDGDDNMHMPGVSSAKACLLGKIVLTDKKIKSDAPSNALPQGTTRPVTRRVQAILDRLTPKKSSKSREIEHERRIALLRTRILREMRENGWRNLAIVPVREGAGATTLCIDLARMIRRHQGTRIMLVDLNLEDPQIARRLGLRGSASYATVVRGGGDLGALLHVRQDQRNFAMLAQAEPEPEASEFLQGQRFANALTRLWVSDPAHIVLMDTAPLLDTDAGLAVLPNADAVLLVANAQETTGADIKECERLLVDMPPLLGVVLNKSEN